MPARTVTRYDIEIRPAFETVEKGHSLRLLIGTGDTPHLLPPPMKLPALLGGVYQLQHNSAAASFIDLPVVELNSPAPRARLVPVTAQILDGKAAAAAIKAELTTRLAALRERGVVPGLGTVLVGDDPGSRWYVNAKHQDCAEVGLESIRVELPATASQADVEKAVDGLNDDPACTTYIVQLPLPRASTRTRSSAASTRRRTPTACTRPTSAGSCWARTPRCRARRAASSSCCDATTSRSPAQNVVVVGSRHHGRTPAGAAPDPPQRERHRHAVPHRNP